MADFKTPNLCGANEALNNASSKINDIKAEIESKLDSAASEAAAAFSTAQADIKAGLDALAQDLPETPNVNFQSEITSLINNIDRTTVEGLSAYNAKVAQLQADFGEALKEKGLELDKLISESSTRLGKDVSTATTAIGDAIGDVTGAIGGAISDVTSAVGDAVSSVTGGLTGATPSIGSYADDASASLTGGTTGGTGDICDLIPNLEIPADISGTGKTTQEIEERSSTSTLTLTQTPKEIISVQGKKSDQSFFTNIQYTQNGKVIVPKQTGIYDTIKVVFTVSLIKEKPIAAKQADVPPEKEEVSIVTPNVSAVEKKTEFKFSSLIKKLDNVSLGNVDSTKVNSDISSALSAIKSPEFKAKMQADLDYAAAERKKLFADPLNYKQVPVNSPSSSSSGKSRTVKVDTVETQNTTTTTKVETSGGGVTEVKRTSKATISDKGFTHRQVRKKEYFLRPNFRVSTSTIANKKTGKTFAPVAVKKINGRTENPELLKGTPILVMKNVVYDVERITARSYDADGSYVDYRWGVKKKGKPLEYQSVGNNILPDWTTADKNIKIEYNNRVTNKLESSFPTPIDIIKITYTYVEKIDPNYSG